MRCDCVFTIYFCLANNSSSSFASRARIVLLDQSFDSGRRHFQFFQNFGDIFPALGPGLSFRQIEFGDLLAQSLQQNRLLILVVVLDDILLVLGEIGH